MKNILVTGIAGFIGSQLAKSLLNDGYSVTGIDNFKTGFNENIPSGAKFIEGDCSLADTYTHTLLKDAQFDFIVHLAGQSSGEVSFDDPVQDLSDNCASTLQLLKFARNISCTKFIFASSMSVYGSVEKLPVKEDHPLKPLSMYAVGKLASEAYLRIYGSYNISSVSLRLFNVYGPGQNMSNMRQGMASIYISQALRYNHIEVKGGADRFRDFVYIDDVIGVICNLISHDFEGSKIVNVCTGIKTQISELLQIIKKYLPREGVAVSFLEGTPGDQFGIVGDNQRLNDLVGVQNFVNLEEGIKTFIEYLNKDL